MSSVNRTRVATPITLLLGVVGLCLVTAVVAIAVARGPAWLGTGLQGHSQTPNLTIASLTPGGPFAQAGPGSAIG